MLSFLPLALLFIPKLFVEHLLYARHGAGCWEGSRHGSWAQGPRAPAGEETAQHPRTRMCRRAPCKRTKEKSNISETLPEKASLRLRSQGEPLWRGNIWDSKDVKRGNREKFLVRGHSTRDGPGAGPGGKRLLGMESSEPRGRIP